MRTWATIFNALSRSEISAQLRNSHMYIIEQNKSCMATELTNQSINHKISYVGPPPKLISIFAWIDFISSINWNYKIEFMFILKHFKSWQIRKGLVKKKMAAKFYWNWDSVMLKILKMKDEKMGIIWKSDLEKDIYKMGFKKSFKET